MSGLSPEQVESLATFQSVTSIESEEDAKRRLEAASWNLQTAVENFLSGTSPPPTPSRQEVGTGGTGDSVANGGNGDGERNGGTGEQSEPTVMTPLLNRPGRPAQQPRRGFRGFFRALFFPIWLVFSIASFIGDKITKLVRGPSRIEYDPNWSESQNFEHRFNTLYSTSHPTMFDGTLAQAVTAAGARFKFLLVFLHSELNPASERFCRNVLAAPDVVRYINENFVFWARGVSTAEGLSANNAIEATTYPTLAIMTSRRGRPNGFCLSIYDDVNRGLIPWLELALERFGSSLTSARREREERDQARQLREQQDREYFETLENDRRREMEAQKAAEEAAEEERKKLEAVELEKKKLEDLAARREEKKALLGEQPEKGPDVTAIVLRLPDGTRVDRRFKKSDVVGLLFDWADVQGVAIEHAALVSSFPRKQFLYPEDAEKTLQEAGLGQGAMLLVEERPEAEEEEG